MDFIRFLKALGKALFVILFGVALFAGGMFLVEFAPIVLVIILVLFVITLLTMAFY